MNRTNSLQVQIRTSNGKKLPITTRERYKNTHLLDTIRRIPQMTADGRIIHYNNHVYRLEGGISTPYFIVVS